MVGVYIALFLYICRNGGLQHGPKLGVLMEADTPLKEIPAAASDVAWLVTQDPRGQASRKGPLAALGSPTVRPLCRPTLGWQARPRCQVLQTARDMEQQPTTYGRTAARWENPRLRGLRWSASPIIFLTSD